MQPTPAYIRLERAWAEFCGVDPAHMVVCSSGTAAGHLAWECLRNPRKTVVMADWTMAMCARSVLLAGMVPAFVDVRDGDFLLDDEGLGGFLQSVRGYDTAGILVAHLHGRRQEMDPIIERARYHGCSVVEDLCEAQGVPFDPRSDAAYYSFQRSKIVAGEEGGAVWFRDPAHANLARSLRSCGFTEAHDYTHIPRGVNARLADSLAEKVLESLRTYPDRRGGYDGTVFPGNATMRRVIEGWYDAHCPPEWKMPHRDAVWIYDLFIPGLTRDLMKDVVTALRVAGVEARYGFVPMTLTEEFSAPGTTGPNALSAYHEVFSLPVRPGTTTETDCRRAFEVVREVVG